MAPRFYSETLEWDAHASAVLRPHVACPMFQMNPKLGKWKHATQLVSSWPSRHSSFVNNIGDSFFSEHLHTQFSRPEINELGGGPVVMNSI